MVKVQEGKAKGKLITGMSKGRGTNQAFLKAFSGCHPDLPR